MRDGGEDADLEGVEVPGRDGLRRDGDVPGREPHLPVLAAGHIGRGVGGDGPGVPLPRDAIVAPVRGGWICATACVLPSGGPRGTRGTAG